MKPSVGVKILDRNEKENRMHIQVINFNIKISHKDYEKGALELAPIFADLPGLISKHWLVDKESNTYGGVYIWADKNSFENYGSGEVFAAVKNNDDFENVTSKDYGIIAAPTEITRGF